MRSATMMLLVVNSLVRKSGTLSGWRKTAALGRARGVAGSTRSRITTITSYSPGATENPRLILAATASETPAEAGSRSTGKIASTGYAASAPAGCGSRS